jgi:hypothetical protein
MSDLMSEHHEIFHLLDQADRLIDELDFRIKACAESSFSAESLHVDPSLDYEACGVVLRKMIAHFLSVRSASVSIQRMAEERLEMSELSLVACYRLMDMRCTHTTAPEMARSERLRRRFLANESKEVEPELKCSHSGCPMSARFLKEGESVCIAHFEEPKK